jgi:phosphatidylglycerophosphate synthase
MYERRDFRRRRRKEGKPEVRSRYGGGRMTFMSFFAIVACLAVIKARNADASIGPMVLAASCVAVACLIMSRIGGRNRHR